MEGKNIDDQLERNKSRQSKKNNKDIVGMVRICRKGGNIKLSLEDKMEVWKEYEEKLLNEENERSRELNVKKMKGLVKQCR